MVVFVYELVCVTKGCCFHSIICTSAMCCLSPNYGHSTERVALYAGDYTVKERVVEVPIHVPVDVPIPAPGRADNSWYIAGWDLPQGGMVNLV